MTGQQAPGLHLELITMIENETAAADR